MINAHEYTPALYLILTEGLTDKMDLLMLGDGIVKNVQALSGVNDSVITLVVVYLIVKLVLDHMGRHNKAKVSKEYLDGQKNLAESIDRLNNKLDGLK